MKKFVTEKRRAMMAISSGLGEVCWAALPVP